MSVFTYLASSQTNRDKVRRYINDTVEGSGPLPGDKNFTDDELTMILTAEGTQPGQWQRAAASCLEQLAAAWIRYPSFQGDGISISRSHIARNYQMQAEQLRKRYGYAPGSTIQAQSVVRVDGYNVDDTPSDEVDN
jgi:hypothetical protein